MASLAELELMRKLAIGSNKLLAPLNQPSQAQRRTGEAGFTLIELLVAIAIMAIVLGMAVLTIPNHDERYWRDNLDQLVASLNMAQEESAMAGTPIVAQIDALGWRFYAPTNTGAMTTMGNAALVKNGIPIAGTSGLMPDVYRPQAWNKPVEMAALQLTLGGEQIMQALQTPIAQENRQAVLIRNAHGQFSWVKR